MSRETAITESISYDVKECHFCGAEVGLGADIPENELVKSGRAVLVGDGDVSISEERKGNWDVEVEFSGNQSDVSPPTVTGHILCAECAENIHGYSQNGESYQGPLPNELTNETGNPNLSVSIQTLVAVVGFVLLLMILLII